MKKFRDLLYTIIPKPRALGELGSQAAAVERFLVLTLRENPTFPYYLEERLNRSIYPNQVRYPTDRLDDIDPAGVFVIICRYVRPRQLLWLYRNRKRIAGAALFIDDNLAAIFASIKGEYAYKVFISVLGILPLLILNRILTEIWVSTAPLGEALAKNGQQEIKVMGPLPTRGSYEAEEKTEAAAGSVLMAFHTDRCHETEHLFLVPIVREAMRRCSNLNFEVVAAGGTAKLWRDAGLPAGRFRIRKNQGWLAYLDSTRKTRIDILLVPLARNPVNDARAGTKRIDAVRMGAAAVFSRCHVYLNDSVAEEIFVDQDVDAWVEVICQLVQDQDLRQRTRAASARAIGSIVSQKVSIPPFHPS